MENNEIDVMDLIRIAIKRFYLIIISMIVLGAVCFVYGKYFVVPRYEVNTKYCIQTKGQNVDSDVIESQRTVAYAQLVLDTYIDILDTWDFAEEIAFYMNGGIRASDTIEKKNEMIKIAKSVDGNEKYTAKQIKDMVVFHSEEEKVSFDVRVKSVSATEAYAVARCIETAASDYIENKYPGVGLVTVIDKAIPAKAPVNDKTLVMTLVGMLIGAVLAMVISVLIEKLDLRVTDEKKVTEKTGLAVIGSIPDIYFDKFEGK